MAGGDGHYGLENREAGRHSAGKFHGFLGYLIEDGRRAHFVFHISPTGGYLSELSAERFLTLLGLRSFNSCQFFGGPCFYQYVFEAAVERHGSQDQVQYAHSRFKSLIDSLPEIYEQTHEIFRKLGSIPDLFPRLAELGPAKIPDLSGNTPAWLDEYKLQDHVEIESQLSTLSEQHQRYSAIERVLWEGGEELEDASHILLEDVGFDVQRTPKGSTVDLLAGIAGTDLEFGIEITGINDAIKKKSNKIGQALAFLQQRDGSEKPVILANTYNDQPPQSRPMPAFTDEAVSLMSPMGIVGLTTVTLYEAWKQIKAGSLDVRTFAKSLFEFPGGELTLD